MSGSAAFAPSRKPKPGPIERRLAVEDDRRLFRFLGAGHVAGAWFAAWALTVQILVPPEILAPPPPRPDEDPPRITFRPPPRTAPEAGPARIQPRDNPAREAVSRRPSPENGRIQVAEIASRKDGDWGERAYALIEGAIKGVDMEKIEGAARLTRTDPTRLAGRRGKFTEAYNPGFTDGHGGDSLDPGLLAVSPATRLQARPKGPQESVGASSLTVSSEGRFRSSESILAVVRAHSPGLRHLYNTHLKLNPGLAGKATVRFAVSPSGRVVDAAMVSATTGSRVFEDQVLARIRTWRFEAIKAVGNDIVTVPFNFSE